MGISDFLFGKKKYFETNKLGIFTTRVRNENNVREYVWKSSITIDNYYKDIVILLEGDALAPLKNHLETATWVIENIKEIDKEVIGKIKNNAELSEKYKNKNLADLRLDLIYPSIEEIYKFELSYILLSDNDFSVTAAIQNKQILDVM